MIRRHVTDAVRIAVGDRPVVLIHGARQTGKSTLARALIADGYRAAYVTLDDAGALAAAQDDPDGFVSGLPRAVVLDEVQKAPGLFRAIKLSVDRDRVPGRFLLTGSADVLLLPRLSESLAGRMELLTLWPLSQGELEGHREIFIDELFDSGPLRGGESREIRNEVIERLIRGGYPELVADAADDARREAWFRSYLTAVVRDMRDLAEIEKAVDAPRLLRLVAARSMSLLNFAELSRSSELAQSTLKRYFALLETMFLVQRLPAWAGSLSRRLIKAPKVLLSDTGLAAHLQGVNATRFALDPSLVGPLLENFVVMELTKQLGWSKIRPALHHFRSVTGEEVDIVLEARDGRLVGIEVKARLAIGSDDFKGLRALAARTKKKFHRGVLLYLGRTAVPFGPNLQSLPLTAVWRT